MPRSPGLLALLSLALVTPFGCRDDGAGATPYDDLATAEIDALCDYFVRCGYAASAALCVDVFGPALVFPADLDAAIDNGTVIYDADAAGACLDAVRGASCTNYFETFVGADACEQVFDGTIADGQSCWIDEQCISGACGGTECNMACCQGTCIPPIPDAAIGEDCSEADCVDGAYCDFEVQTCIEQKAAGEACPVGYECATGLTCGNGICGTPPGEGQPCADFGCALPLSCDIDTMTCQPLRGEGEACNPDYSPCLLGLTCDPNSSTCTVPAGLGAACDSAFLGTGCGGEAYCDYDFETGDGTCQPLVADGGACTDDYVCRSQYCGAAQTCEPEPVCVQ